MNITLFASSSEKLNKKYYEEAKIFAKYFALTTHLIYGAGNLGIMKIFGDEFHKRNRQITGVITKKLDTMGVGSNEICTEYIVTDTLPERKDILVNKGHIIVVAPGGIGTIDEMMHVVAQNQLGHLNKQVFLLNSTGFFDSFLEFINKLKKENFIYDNKKYFNNIKSIKDLDNFFGVKDCTMH